MSGRSETDVAWSVYMIETRMGSLYTGISTDVERRFGEHQGSAKGAKALRGKGPLKLVYQQALAGKSEALKEEARIKKMSRTEKLALIAKA